MRNRSFGDLPIAGKLNIVLIGSVVLVLGFAGLFLGQWLGQKIEARSLEDLKRTNRQVVDMIDAYAAVLERSAEMLGGQLFVTLPKAAVQDVHQANSVLETFSQATGAVATVFTREGDDFKRIATTLRNDKGERAVGTSLGANHPAYALIKSGQPYTGRATLFGQEYMTRYLPIIDASGQVAGIAFIGINFTEGLAALKKKVLAIKVGETGYTFALDAVKTPGMAVIHSTAEGKNLIDAKDPNGRLIVREMLDMKEGVLHYAWANAQNDTQRREKVVVVDHFAKWGWVVGSGSYVDEFTRDVRGVQIQFALAGLAVVIALIVAIYFSTHYWLTVPLGEALAVTQRVADGDLTVSVKVTHQDEVGRLLTATDRMCVQLRGMITEVNDGIATLAGGVSQMAASSEQVASSSGTQSDAAAAMAAAVEQMTVSIDRVSVLSQDARTMAESSGATSDTGAAVIGSAIREMGSIATTVRNSSGSVAELGEQSQQIASIVNVIREIADQTNLLALNAAIEAARAGEQGRGFAVVADEVRKLAERTTQSTQEIAQMVERIQNGARQAVDSMNVGVSQVEQGVELANKAGGSIAEIKTGADRVGVAVIGIADALREQTAASQDIARNVERIAQQAEQNHSQAQQTSSAAIHLVDLAQHLHQSIARFRT
jgi:methyl-accepting chemotaxis protein